ncbi:MAG: hypothetical protein Ct9H300mP3_01360 [Gammaproteobacteria bacterium]|nr:MAG: hypothetical protein Ct9H300mP3_01360 [Gammaproteobacteria bacterium]
MDSGRAIAEDHYGHKNVMFLDIEEGKVPLRPNLVQAVFPTDGMRKPLEGKQGNLSP